MGNAGTTRSARVQLGGVHAFAEIHRHQRSTILGCCPLKCVGSGPGITVRRCGKISADAAAPGGRGLENAAWQTHLDSWDVPGEWGMHVHEIENYFDVPLEKE